MTWIMLPLLLLQDMSLRPSSEQIADPGDLQSLYNIQVYTNVLPTRYTYDVYERWLAPDVPLMVAEIGQSGQRRIGVTDLGALLPARGVTRVALGGYARRRDWLSTVDGVAVMSVIRSMTSSSPAPWPRRSGCVIRSERRLSTNLVNRRHHATTESMIRACCLERQLNH